jgi:CheY-like chemotaxis protein
MDPTQLEQVILNLAINARDAMPLGGKLILRTEDIIFENDKRHQNVLIKSGSYIKLSVSDTGIGMKPEIQSHIFEPFFTTKEKGTGLGLATIYGIIKQGDGYITVDSFPEKGTTFEIFFPRQEMSIEKEEEIPRVEIKFTGSEKIMVIEDDELVRNLTVSFLENFGYKVTQASSSQIALQICVDKPNVFDLAIIDVVMPGISGKKLAERISESQKNIKVLFISGYTDEAIVQHGILDSSVHFLQKPFSAKTLAQKTRSILDDI